LKERKGDITSLVQHFMVKKCREMGLHNIPSIAHGAFERLQKYDWPGNVRELENMIERALILNKGEPVNFEALTLSKSDDTAVKDSSPQSDMDHHEGSLALDDVISSHIRKVLNIADGQVGGNGGAAEILRINASTLRKKMNKLGIKYGRKRL
jgi:DNA-binding NtrC family response regulator